MFFQEGPGVRKWQYTETGVKLLNVGNLNQGQVQLEKTDRHVSDEEAYGRYKHFLVEAGDLLIGSSGVTVETFHKKIAFAKEEHLPLCMNTSTIRFRPLDENEVDINYFKYFLTTRLFTSQLRKLICGSAQLNFGPSHLKQMSIPLPPLSEQKRIVDILDKADAIRRKRQQAIEEAGDYVPSLFRRLFGDPVNNGMNWPLTKLGELATNEDGRRKPVKSSDRQNMQGEYPYYGASGIIDHVDSYLFDETALLIGEDGANLLARSTPIAFIASGKYWVNNHAHVLTPNGNASLRYLETHLNMRSIKDFVTGSAQPKLNQSNLNKIPIPTPPKKLQDRFDDLLTKHKSMMNRYRSAEGESTQLFNSLVQRAFKGGL